MTKSSTSPESEPKIPGLYSIENFLFSAPLYAEYNLRIEPTAVYKLFVEHLVIDGHCPYCQKASTFRRSEGEMGFLQCDDMTYSQEAWRLEITCARNET